MNGNLTTHDIRIYAKARLQQMRQMADANIARALSQPGAPANNFIAQDLDNMSAHADHLRELGLLAQQHGDEEAFDLIANGVEQLQTALMAQAHAVRMASIPRFGVHDLAQVQP